LKKDIRVAVEMDWPGIWFGLFHNK